MIQLQDGKIVNNCIFSLKYYFSKHERNLHSHFLIQDVCTAMKDYYPDPTEARTRIDTTQDWSEEAP